MREFAVSTGNTTVPNQLNSLVTITAPGAPAINLEFLRFWVGQAANATSAQQRIQFVTVTGSLPSLTGATPSKLKFADANASAITSNAFAGTTWGTGGSAGVGVNSQTEYGGSRTTAHEDAFNVLNGWLHVPTPPETRVLPATFSGAFSMVMPAAPATLTSWSYGLIFREV